MALCESDPDLDFLFGLAGNKVLSPKSRPLLEQARALHRTRAANAARLGNPAPEATRLYDDVEYQAGSWPRAYRVVVKAEVMALGDNPRYVVTSLTDPTPQSLYRDLYCARGQDENFIKAVKNDLARDRTSDHAFLANHLRLFYSCAAYVLMHSLRENTRVHTELAKAQPMSIILKLFKLAVRVVQYNGSDQAVLAQFVSDEGRAGASHRVALPGAASSSAGLIDGTAVFTVFRTESA